MTYGKALDRLEDELARVDALLALGENGVAAFRPAISDWSIAQQLDHLLRSIVVASDFLLEERDRPRGGINLLGRVLLLVGRLPRGRARSPEVLVGRPLPVAELRRELDEVRSRIAALAERRDLASDREPRVPHPYFGGLTATQTVHFVGIHTDHHLRIAEEIREAAG